MPKLKYVAGLFIAISFLLPTITLAGPLTGAQDLLQQAAGGKDIGFETNLASSTGVVVAAALSLVGTIFLILVIYAGILWMTAGGKEESIEKARKIVTAAIIGLFITMAAYAITIFVTGKLGGASSSPDKLIDVCEYLGDRIRGQCFTAEAAKVEPKCNANGAMKQISNTNCEKDYVCCYTQ